MATFIKLFGVDIRVSSMKGDDDHDIELRLRLKPPCCVAVYDPTPLRQFRPPNEKRNKKKKKREHGESIRGSGKRRRVQEPDHSIPPQLLEKVESREGTTEPVFLYQKKLTKADAKEDQSRLFVLKREEFKKLLTDDESGIFNGTRKRLKNIVCVDKLGRFYKLGLTVWPSLDMLVINSEWSKLVKENDAKEDDWVQIWGHRDHIGNLCMAINFINAA